MFVFALFLDVCLFCVFSRSLYVSLSFFLLGIVPSSYATKNFHYFGFPSIEFAVLLWKIKRNSTIRCKALYHFGPAFHRVAHEQFDRL
jgi:hypothetical protein